MGTGSKLTKEVVRSQELEWRVCEWLVDDSFKKANLLSSPDAFRRGWAFLLDDCKYVHRLLVSFLVAYSKKRCG